MRHSLLPLSVTGVLALAGCKPDSGLTKFNSTPEAAITAPADGATVLAGTAIELRGAASDANHGTTELIARWFVADAEACGSSAPAADGTTTCNVIVPDSTDLAVRLEVLDPEGAAASATVSLLVTPNEDPVATIRAPLADGVYYSDQLVTLRGTASDAEDAPGALTVAWESSRDGVLSGAFDTPDSSGGLLGATMLSEGPHFLTLTVVDSAGNTGRADVTIDVGPPNASPTCSITAPTSGGASEAGASVAFAASVGDADIDPNLLQVRWSSDKDGELGLSTPDSTGAVSFRTSALSADDHRITMTVTDEVGATCAAAIDWTVGTPPGVTLESPLPGEVANEGTALTFSALVSDGEDVPGDLRVTWESDLDGVFHEGPPDSTGVAQLIESGLSVGDHALTVTVTDSDGLYATALGTFTVNGLPTAPGVSLAPGSPNTDDDLRVLIDAPSADADGDPLTYAYVWSVDGVMSGASSSGTLPASATARGEVWTVAVTATDGIGTGPAGTAVVTIANSAPVVAVALTPGSATRTSTLTCSGSTSDLDGDAPSLGFAWTVDGVPVSASSATATLSTLSGAFTAGQRVTCAVTADDGAGGADTGSASVTIGNTVPTVSVSLAPAPVYTDGVLTASATPADADGDTLSVRYDWYVDGALVQSGPDATLAGATSFDRDQVVYVTATVDDGVDSASATSGSVTVSNSAPTAPVVAITPGDATSGDDLTCTIVTESADADGDTIAYAFSWEVDGAAYAGAADSATESVVDGVDVEGGETWACIASAFDGTARSAVNSTELDIGCEEVLSEDWSSGVGPGWLSAYGSLAVNDGRLQIQRAAGQWGRVSRDLPDPLGALTLQVTLEVQDSASDIAICFVDTSSPTSLIGVLYAPTASLHHGVCVVLNNETLNGSIAGIHITENIGNVNLPVVAGTAIVASHAASVVAGVSREVVLVHDGFGVWRVLLDGVIVGSGLGPTGAYDALTIYGGNDSYDNHGGYVDDIRVFECDI